MNHEEWHIESPEGHKIYGVTNSSGTPSDKAIVMAHGFTSNINKHPFPMFVSVAVEAGYDVIRISLYSDKECARRFRESTAKTFALDLSEVLAKKTGRYKNTFLVGHSYGGPAIMKANPENIAAASLWDPSYDFVYLWKYLYEKFGIEKKDELYVVHNAIVPVCYWQPVIDESRQDFDREQCRDLSRNAKFPVQVFHAGKCIYKEYGESFHTYCPHETEYHAFDEADHCFTQLPLAFELYEKTLQWFGRF